MRCMARLGEGTGTTFGCTNAICVSSQLQFTPSEAAELNFRLCRISTNLHPAVTHILHEPTMMHLSCVC